MLLQLRYMYVLIVLFSPMQCYASMVLAVALSFCPSQASIVLK